MLRQRPRQIFESGRRAAFAFAVASTASFGCTETDPGSEGETGNTPTTEPTTEPDDDSTTVAESETTMEPADSSSDDTDPTTDPTTDTEDTSDGRVVECGDPGATMIWDGDIYIDEPADIELLAGHSGIDGDVRIFNQVIDNIDALACITSVTGNIQIFDTALTDLAGLGNVAVIGGSLSISENPSLTLVHGFNGLETLGTPTGGGAFIITKNPMLTGVYGFESLTEVTLGINIDENATLTEIAGLDALVAVGSVDSDTMPGNYPDLSIAYNPELSSIRGPVGMKALGGQLVIQANPKLCISEVESLATMLVQWIQEGMGDTTGNKGDC